MPTSPRWTAGVCLVITLILCIGVVSDSVAGEINGRVEILRAPASQQGAISPYARTRRIDDVQTGSANGEEIIAVVYLEKHPGLATGNPPTEHPQVNQLNMTIVPHITAVTVGTTVDFPNSDDIYHNLFSLSPARKFDLGRYAKGHSKSITFDEVGEVRIYCDIHPSMSGVVLVLPNFYFATVGPDGLYSIRDVPPGNYRIHAWHESLSEQIKNVTVPDAGSVDVDFILGIQ